MGKGLERGFTICDTQKLCPAENTHFIVFSAKHSFKKKKRKLKRKQKFTKNRGLFANMKTGVFLFVFCYLVVLCVFVLSCLEKAQKRQLYCNF